MIQTRRNTGARPQGATHGLRAVGGSLQGMSLGTILGGSAMAGLLGATACAVASVSAWLVPVYLLGVAAIFTAPRGPRRSPTATGTTPEREHVGSRPGIDDPAEGGDATSAPSEAGGSVLAEQPTGGPEVRLDPAAPAIPKPRKSRARSRKAAKAVEPAAEPAPVTWIRVGPGQYVRADAVPQGPPPVEGAPAPSPEAAPTALIDEAPPADDAPEADAPATGEPATIAQPETVAPVATDPPPPACDASAAESTDDAPAMGPEATPEAEPTFEEYGNAPSALEPTIAPPTDVVVPDADPPTLVLARRSRRPSGMFTRLVPRGLRDRAPSRSARGVPSRRVVRAPAPVPRRDSRPGVAARRGTGRTSQVRHPWRARSPP